MEACTISDVISCQMEFYKLYLICHYSNPSTYVASINVVSIYIVKFFVYPDFNLCRHLIYIAFFRNMNRSVLQKVCSQGYFCLPHSIY